MKKIAISLSLIGIVAAVAVIGTVAYFSDTETSTGNVFTAGTIDISVDDQNPWEGTFTLVDMKPCYTDYINFRIDNDLSDPNPVNIFKKIIVTLEETGTVSEPECEAEGGTWLDNGCINGQGIWEPDDDLSSVIWYDLYIEVYDAQDNLIWYQTIYSDGQQKSIDDAYGVTGQEHDVYLGMIPAGGYMLVEQSYHLMPDAGNEYQGDSMSFNIEVKGEQLKGSVMLENKDTSGDPWLIEHNDAYNATLTYEVKNPTFDFTVTGVVPLPNEEYCLFVGGNAGGGSSWDPDQNVGCETSNASGNITITGSVNTGDMKDAKAWLVADNNGSSIDSWGSMGDWLWETGMIWYEDTDL